MRTIGPRKKTARMLAALLLAGALAFSGMPAAHANGPAAQDGGAPLRFASDGTFTILLLSDLMETQKTSPELLRALDGLLESYPVDLAILLGNQLDGENAALNAGYGYDNVKSAIDRLVGPLAERGVPFAAVFGASDGAAPASIKHQRALYGAYENYVGPVETADGAYALPVYTNDGAVLTLNLYLFDSAANEDGVPAVDAAQVDWYRAKSQTLRDENSGLPVPSIAFFNAPLSETRELYAAVPDGTAGAFTGMDEGRRQSYLPSGDRIFTGDMLESPHPAAENNGLFDAFLAGDDVFLSVSGGSPLNSFIGSVHGIDLASAPGGSYKGGGSESVRGARLFRFTEFNVRDYETIHVRFSDYGGGSALGALFSPDTPLFLRLLPVLLPGAALAALAVVLVCRRKNGRPLFAGPEDDFEEDGEER